MNQITEEDMIRSIFNIGDGVDEIPAYYLENESVIFHLGISGGKDSAAAFFKLIYESDIDPKRIICTMSDTKNEDPLTMAFVSLMAKHHPIQIHVDTLDDLATLCQFMTGEKHEFNQQGS
jgi:hypothetical protein